MIDKGIDIAFTIVFVWYPAIDHLMGVVVACTDTNKECGRLIRCGGLKCDMSGDISTLEGVFGGDKGIPFILSGCLIQLRD
jgi:hypothetical protein